MNYGFTGGGASKKVLQALTFNGNRPVTRAGIPGLTGVNLGGQTLQQWAEGFYPSVAPGAVLSGGTTREYGDSPNLVLNWQALRNTNPINYIEVASTVVAPTGATQSGSVAVTGVQNLNTVWGLLVRSTAGEQTQVATTLLWASRRRVGRIGKTGRNEMIGGISQLISDEEIRLNANVLTDLTASRVMTLANLQGLGQYLYFWWPTRYGLPPLNNGKPTFKVNNLDNNAFTLVRSNSPFVNQFGYTENGHLIVSDTIYAGTVTLSVP
jgi:hypothetical protein